MRASSSHDSQDIRLFVVMPRPIYSSRGPVFELHPTPPSPLYCEMNDSRLTDVAGNAAPGDTSLMTAALWKIALLTLTGISCHYSLTPPHVAKARTVVVNKTFFERTVQWFTFCSKVCAPCLSSCLPRLRLSTTLLDDGLDDDNVRCSSHILDGIPSRTVVFCLSTQADPTRIIPPLTHPTGERAADRLASTRPRSVLSHICESPAPMVLPTARTAVHIRNHYPVEP